MPGYNLLYSNEIIEQNQPIVKIHCENMSKHYFHYIELKQILCEGNPVQKHVQIGIS